MLERFSELKKKCFPTFICHVTKYNINQGLHKSFEDLESKTSQKLTLIKCYHFNLIRLTFSLS